MAHREQKTTFGLGDPQCWHATATVTTTQWTSWLFGAVLLPGLTA